MNKYALLVASTILLCSKCVSAEKLKDQIPEPNAKLEQFSAKTEVVIIRGVFRSYITWRAN
ncbi:MAG: hypothetical protein HWE10_01025 [Gammaproteobacteria bacterium]|nr:hypothetical protein [Gammaproteobacteria bacterium]